MGQDVSGARSCGAGRRGAELRGAGRRWGKISGAGGHGAEGSGAGGGSLPLFIVYLILLLDSHTHFTSRSIVEQKSCPFFTRDSSISCQSVPGTTLQGYFTPRWYGELCFCFHLRPALC